MIYAKLMELFSKPHFIDNIHILIVDSLVFVSRTHILQFGLKPNGALTDFVTRFSERM